MGFVVRGESGSSPSCLVPLGYYIRFAFSSRLIWSCSIWNGHAFQPGLRYPSRCQPTGACKDATEWLGVPPTSPAGENSCRFPERRYFPRRSLRPYIRFLRTTEALPPLTENVKIKIWGECRLMHLDHCQYALKTSSCRATTSFLTFLLFEKGFGGRLPPR